MASVALSRRVGRSATHRSPELGAEQRREFHEALLDADDFEDLPGKGRQRS